MNSPLRDIETESQTVVMWNPGLLSVKMLFSGANLEHSVSKIGK
jgi:hypothetical protein